MKYNFIILILMMPYFYSFKNKAKTKLCSLENYGLRETYPCLKPPFEGDIKKLSDDAIIDYLLELKIPPEQQQVGSFFKSQNLSSASELEYRTQIKEEIIKKKKYEIVIGEDKELKTFESIRIDSSTGKPIKLTKFYDPNVFFKTLNPEEQQSYVLLFKILVGNYDFFNRNNIKIDGYVIRSFIEHLIEKKDYNRFRDIQENISKKEHSAILPKHRFEWYRLLCHSKIDKIEELILSLPKEIISKAINNTPHFCMNYTALFKVITEKYGSLSSFEQEKGFELINRNNLRILFKLEESSPEISKYIQDILNYEKDGIKSRLESFIKECDANTITIIADEIIKHHKYQNNLNAAEFAYVNKCTHGFNLFSKHLPFNPSKLKHTLNLEEEVYLLYSQLKYNQIDKIIDLIRYPNNFFQEVVKSLDSSDLSLNKTIFKMFLTKIKQCGTDCRKTGIGYQYDNIVKEQKVIIPKLDQFNKLRKIALNAKSENDKKEKSPLKFDLLKNYSLVSFQNKQKEQDLLFTYTIKGGQLHVETTSLKLGEILPRTLTNQERKKIPYTKFDFGISKLYNNKSEIIILSDCKWARKTNTKLELIDHGCDSSNGQPHDIRKHGDHYFVSYHRNISIYDSDLDLVSKIDNPIPKAAHNIQIRNDRIYALDNIVQPIFVFVVDIKNIKKPRIIPHLTIKWLAVNAHLDEQWIKDDHWYIFGSYSTMGGYGHTLTKFNLASGVKIASASLHYGVSEENNPFNKILGLVQRYPEIVLHAEGNENRYNINSKFYLSKPVINGDKISFVERKPLQMSESFFTDYGYLANVKEFEDFILRDRRHSGEVRLIINDHFITLVGSRGIQINLISGELIGFFPNNSINLKFQSY